MAVAEKRVERRVIEDVTVTLKLSEDEARTLVAVLMLTAGSRKTSPREHVVNILDALRRAGATRPDPFGGALATNKAFERADPSNLAEGMVRFRDYPEGA
jgi:hypothetical protein